MANGGSSLPSPRSTPSGLPAMPFPPKPSTSTAHQTLQPHQNHGHRQSTETITSIASSNGSSNSSQDQSPRRSRRATRPASTNPHDDDPQLSPKSHAPLPRPRQVLGQHHHHRHSSSSSSSPSPPPMRDLPAVRPTYEALLGQHPSQSLGEADQFEEVSSNDAEMILAGLYGFPYSVPLPDALEQRSRAIAEAEELEYQMKSWKQKARLSGRVEAALKGLSLPGSRPRSRTDRKF